MQLGNFIAYFLHFYLPVPSLSVFSAALCFAALFLVLLSTTPHRSSVA